MPEIKHYRFGQVTIDGTTYNSDVIVYPSRVNDNWWRHEGHVLKLQDLTEALAAEPEVLVVGTGAHERLKIGDEVTEELGVRGIELIALETPDAVERYNELQGERRTVAALHLTC